MPRLSKEKIEKISEQVLHYLFTVSPNAKFTSDIAREIARDEEFIKALLLDLRKKGLVILINKSSSGSQYKRRQRWRLSNQTHSAYSKHQSPNNNTYNSNTLE